ncbi:MAG: right-handed parallel beta-helix repeat-containing protein, partial [Anaerolineae bacterium]
VESNANTIFGNHIGTDASGVKKLGNGYYGVHVVGGFDNSVSSNTIAHNGADGVRVEGSAAVRNRITVNSITANGGKGIELLNGGNTELAPPAITNVAGGSVSGTACAGCTVEVFSDPVDEGQYVHSPPYALADLSGNWSWSGAIAGKNVTATATDGAGNTSELSVGGWAFTGLVDLTTGPPFPRPIPAEVSLYGSQVASELGERLAGVPTSGDGAYELRYGGAGDEPIDYRFYNVVVADPAYEVTSAASASGGRATDDGWIQFEALPPGAYPHNNFTTFSSHPEPRLELEPGLQTHPGPFGVVKEEDFVIDGIEVTQAIQCFDQTQGDTGKGSGGTQQVCSKDNALPLAAGKPAVVRVYATTNNVCFGAPKTVAKVRVDLHVDGGTDGFTRSTYFKVLCTPFFNRRKWGAGSANFYLTVPTARKVSLWAEVNPNKAWPEPDYTNNRYPATGTVDAEFKTRKPLSVGYVQVDYHPQKSRQYLDYSGPSKPTAKWVASTAAHELFDAIYPSDSLSYVNRGMLPYNGPDVRDDLRPVKPVCGWCNLLNKLYKHWLSWKQSTACLKGVKCPVPDQIFGWLPKKAFESKGWVGVSHAKHGGGKAAIGEAENNVVLAHEVAHNLKLLHAPCKGLPNDKILDPKWPYGAGDARIQEAGFHVARYFALWPDTTDFMDCASDPWISPYHWKKLFDALAPSTTARSAAVSTPQSYVLVSGMVGNDDHGQLDPLIRLESNAAPPDTPTGGEYCLTFYDLSDAPLATYCFDLSFVNPESGEPVSAAYFTHALPYPAEASRVALLHGERVLDEKVASPNAPEISFTSPRDGETWDGIKTIAWTAGDADGDELTFAVFYSHDAGQNWMPVAIDWTETSFQLDTTSLPGGDDVRIRVLAGDGFHTTTADSPALSVPTKAPDVSIVAPADNALLLPEQAMYLSGSAHDSEDGLISDVALSWWSDRDGLLGRDGTLIVPALTLSPGWHTITLRAADNDGQIGLARVNVFVGHRIFVPLVMR